jgi:hypothetical protein
MWHFHKLTKEDQAKIIQYRASDDWFKIVQIIIEKEVPPTPLSPCCSLATVKNWVNYGIYAKLISTEGGEI